MESDSCGLPLTAVSSITSIRHIIGRPDIHVVKIASSNQHHFVAALKLAPCAATSSLYTCCVQWLMQHHTLACTGTRPHSGAPHHDVAVAERVSLSNCHRGRILFPVALGMVTANMNECCGQPGPSAGGREGIGCVRTRADECDNSSPPRALTPSFLHRAANPNSNGGAAFARQVKSEEPANL